MFNALEVEPRPANMYSVEIAGLITAFVEEVTPPRVWVTEKKHTPPGAACPTKWGSGVEFEDFKLKLIKPASYPYPWAWAWLNTVIEPISGIQLPEQVSKMDMVIYHPNNKGVPVGGWYIRGASPAAIDEGTNRSDARERNIIQTLTIRCDSYESI